MNAKYADVVSEAEIIAFLDRLGGSRPGEAQAS